MIDDIIDIRLLPGWNSSDIVPALSHSLRKAELLQAAIAYWTINPGVLGTTLVDRLASPSAFVCIDVHLPTDIDALAALTTKGANVRLYSEDITTYRADGKKEPPYLLHSKLLLLWSKDKTAELWVGSHNWTNRALLGLNIEYSAVIRCKDSSPLFIQAAEYLEQIRKICSPFDLARINDYKQLQKSAEERTVPIIEVEARRANGLAGMEISIFGTDERDLKELGTVHRKVYLSATESHEQEAEYIYPAAITQVGELNTGNPAAGRISFSPRRYAFRIGRRFPELLVQTEVSSSVLSTSKYYVTMELQEQDDAARFEYPRARTAVWETAEGQNSPLIERLGTKELEVLFRGRQPTRKVPIELQSESTQALTLPERRALPERSFITRRIVRKGS